MLPANPNPHDPALSRFEFLDEAAPPAPCLPGPYGRAWPALSVPLPLPPVQPRTAWEAMDADYRQPLEPPTPLPLRDLLRPHATPAAVAQRSRLELPLLLVWLAGSCLFHAGLAWLIAGLVMIGGAQWLRATFAVWGLTGQAGLYRALGLGQIAVACATVVNFGPFTPLLGGYGLSVLGSWIFLECRYLYRLERQTMQQGSRIRF
ncbi:MAG: hypothetical protein M3Z04_07405 [Chloroflexota bacterium]|nr:hypothetical protein [Chloroflexota bacterium]